MMHSFMSNEDSASEEELDRAERLMEIAYVKLKQVAESYLRRERKDHTLQATSLVHEAFIKICDYDPSLHMSRQEFVAFASHLMRRVLVDHAIRKNALKRGGGLKRRRITEINLCDDSNPMEVMILDEGLAKLATLSPKGARIVELRFFGGLSISEVAQVMEVSESVVARGWRESRAWLLDWMNDRESERD